jgi:hypothetical protein
MSQIEIGNVDSLEKYVFSLGATLVSLETIYRLQQQALKLDFLETDEKELVTTIAYTTRKVFQLIDSLVKMMGERANIDAEMIANELKEKNYVVPGSNGSNGAATGTTRKRVVRKKKAKDSGSRSPRSKTSARNSRRGSWKVKASDLGSGSSVHGTGDKQA